MIYKCEKNFTQLNFIVSNMCKEDSSIGTIMWYFNFLKKAMKCDFFYSTHSAESPFLNKGSKKLSFPY